MIRISPINVLNKYITRPFHFLINAIAVRDIQPSSLQIDIIIFSNGISIFQLHLAVVCTLNAVNQVSRLLLVDYYQSCINFIKNNARWLSLNYVRQISVHFRIYRNRGTMRRKTSTSFCIFI